MILNQLVRHRTLGVAALFSLALLFLLQRCDKKKLGDITNEQLRTGESTAVVFSPNSGTIKVITRGDRNGNRVRSSLLRGWESESPETPRQSVQSIGGARGVRISVDSDGKASVTVRTSGVIFEPGLVGVLSGERCRLGLDIQWLFYRRWGINTGAVVGSDKSFRLYAAGSYYLPFHHFTNTSLLFGIDSNSKFLVGIKVRF